VLFYSSFIIGQGLEEDIKREEQLIKELVDAKRATLNRLELLKLKKVQHHSFQQQIQDH